MHQIVIKTSTIDRLEKITNEKLLRGGDKAINNALTTLEKRIQELEA